jgi:threonylcarbamoyladenosine tRNA methylthiotransferase MtaB
MSFSRIHAFPYSPREKTAAYQMTDHVPHSIRKDRMQRLLAMGRKLNESFRENSRGQVRSVLWEDLHTVEGKSFWRGLSDTYIPIYISVGDSKVSLRNRITPVLLQDLFKDGLLAMSLDNKLISKDELKRERSYIGD